MKNLRKNGEVKNNYMKHEETKTFIGGLIN